MSSIDKAGLYRLGGRTVKRLGYGAMQLAGPGVFGPPKDRAEAVAVLREAVAAGVDHIDTSDYYGPHVTNEIIREALHPYPADLTLVTKIGGKRGADGAWLRADAPEELRSAVHDNLRNLGLDAIEVVNMRFMFDPHRPADGPCTLNMARRFTTSSTSRPRLRRLSCTAWLSSAAENAGSHEASSPRLAPTLVTMVRPSR